MVLTLPLKLLRLWGQLRSLQLPKVHTMLRVMLDATPPGDGEELRELHRLEAQAKTAQIDSRNCPHRQEAIKRSGNRHGRFAHCVDCNTKWKWVAGDSSTGEIEGWVVWQQQSQLQSQLPVPSPDTILEVIPPTLDHSQKQRLEDQHVTKLKKKAAAENCRKMGTSPTATLFPPRAKAAAVRTNPDNVEDTEIRSTATSSRDTERRRISRRDVEMEVYEDDDLDTIYTGWADDF